MNSDKQVAVYDDSITAREYIGYIAESAGGFACIGRDGKMYIKHLYQDKEEISLDLFKTYTFGEEYKISKVSYEDGTRSFKFGDDTRNNLWINQENIFIVDEEQVKKIYNKVKDLSVNSFNGTVVINPALDIGDKIIIDGKEVVYQGEITLNGRFIADIKSEISIKQQQETTTRKESQTVVNRKVKSQIDQIDGKISQLVEGTTENGERLSKHEQTIDGIKDSISNIEVKIETVESTAKETADNINKNLVDNYYTKTQTDSQIKQESDSITSSVSKTVATAKQEAIDSANISIDDKLLDYSTTEQIDSKITQTAGSINLELSKKVSNEDFTGANIMLQINNDTSEAQINGDKISLERKRN